MSRSQRGAPSPAAQASPEATVEEAVPSSTVIAKPGMTLKITNEDGTEITVAVELSQQRINELLANTKSTRGLTSDESALAHVMHEIVIPAMGTNVLS